MTPRRAPPRGTIQSVGSSEPRARAAKTPTIAATTEARKRPSALGQKALRVVRVSRARLPTLGHQAKPPAMLSSTASMKSRRPSPQGSRAGVATRPDQLVLVKTSASITIVTTTSPGATNRLTSSIERGPRATITQDATSAMTASMLTTPAPLEIRVSKIWLVTLASACPHMIPRTADQAAASSADMTTMSTRAPRSPSTLRIETNCSTPYRPQGRQGASETSRTLMP